MNDKHRKEYNFFVNEGFSAIDNNSFSFLQKTYRHCSRFQEKSLTACVAWQYAYFGLYKILHECLCSFFFHEKQNIYCTIHRLQGNTACPLQSIIDTLAWLCKKAGIPALQIKFIDENQVNEYKAIRGYALTVTQSADSSEYAYKTSDLRELAGTNNYYKRKRVNKFMNMQDISVRPMTKSNVRLCLEVEEQWCRTQECVICSSYFHCEKKALEVIVDIFNEETHRGLLMYHDDKPAGHIICEAVNEKISFVIFGKSLIDDGFLYLIYMMYKDYLCNTEYMNINEDMGHEGLRRFKKLLSHYELWHKYAVTYSL